MTTDGRKRDVGQRSRREVIAMAVGAAAAPLTVPSFAGPVQAQGKKAAAPARRNVRSSSPNIVFIFTDQERYQARWPGGVRLPTHERLARTGVTFHNHYCPATMCTSSRSVILTGLTTPNNGMFENDNVPWMKPLSTKIPTIGHMLRKAGYYTAYKGKWHLNQTFDAKEPERGFTKEMEEYGFADYFGPGDIIGHQLGGYHFDHLIAGSAVAWLRRKGRPLSDEAKPWSLFVSLVNPHDVMFFNTDAPGQNIQDTGTLMMHATRAPDHPMYKATWDVPLPESLREPFDAPGRPTAHGEFFKVWNHVLGHIPLEAERWRRFNDYYINCTRSVDAEIGTILQELDALGLAENTIIVFTSDHGEAAGAHGLHGKGPFAYQETMHLPLYIVHPDVKGGQDCRSLTSHIDFVPTLLSMAGVAPGQVGEIAGRELPGKDISKALSNPRAADVHAVRDSVLFTYSGLMTNDSDIFRVGAELAAAGKDPKVEFKKQGYKPDMKKRGSMRTVFDGRHKFSRYFAPVDRNRPKTIDELYKWNDVELFDLINDPGEVRNLGVDRAANSGIIMTMSEKLETVIKAEIGVDDGREMPDVPNVDWEIDRVDL
jgi:arylsulfatase A-like enzyme